MSDLNLYYRNTVNLLDDRLVRVLHEVDGQLLCEFIGTTETELVDPERLTILNNVQLGWMNTPIGAFYLERAPVRCPKEGLSLDNMIIEPDWDERFPALSFPEEFKKMFFNIYPRKEDAYKEATEKGIIVAFDRYKAFDSFGRELSGLRIKRNVERRIKNVSRTHVQPNT